MINSKEMDSHTELFKSMEILPFYSHIFSLLFFLVNNKHLFTKNLAVHNDIRSANNFHLPFTNLTKYQK
jgi:hypothetical protein